MSDIWSAEYKAAILDELRTANDANEYLSDKLAAATARADAAEADAAKWRDDAERLAEALESLCTTLSRYDDLGWYERGDVEKAQAALAAHDALKGGE